MHLTLDALLVLDAIDRNGSFAAAAEELHRVRSALTYTVRKLERDLGVTLFDRSQHRAKLTEIGRTLLTEGNDLLRSAYDLERTVKRLKNGEEEEIFIAVDETISINKIYELVTEFYEAYPAIKLNITTEILNGCWDALVAERADLAIGVSGDAPIENEYGMFPLGQIKFAFAVAPHHPLAKLPNPLKNTQIIKHRAVVAADSTRKLTKRSIGILSGQETLTVSSMQAKIQAQIMGLGVGYLPLNLIHKEIQTKKLIVKTTQKAKPTANLSVAWRLNKTGKGVKWFLEKLKDPTVGIKLTHTLPKR